ncbi:MAG: hypothetical protein L3J69_12670 [Desulfobacula sp.]|nr:hypothetical protein [Desulfobacula sp.]
MDTFGFTQKKFMSLSNTNQHRHLINWLIQFYQKLTTNRVHHDVFIHFSCQYNQILKWADMAVFIEPVSHKPRLWIEAISDRIQYHRLETGATIRDPDLLEPVQTQDLTKPVFHENIDCHVALDGLRSLFNVGSIFRTCDAAGFNSVILANTKGKEDIRVQKTAMGSQEWINQEKTCDLFETLLKKKGSGYKVVGVETIKGARPYDEMPWKKKTIVVFGNEEYGISSHALGACEQFVYLPMFGRKNSINVATAVSVVCFRMVHCIRRLPELNKTGRWTDLCPTQK